MSAATLTPRALYEEVAELLRQRIFKRELEPGSWIDELKLAEEYGISRTPLREALKVLATEGLVTMTRPPRRAGVLRNSCVPAGTSRTASAPGAWCIPWRPWRDSSR